MKITNRAAHGLCRSSVAVQPPKPHRSVVVDSTASTYERPPPSTGYLSSRIEKRLEEILGDSSPTRVVDSWRYLSQDYEHREYVGTDPTKTPETSNCHQQAHSYVPGLPIKTFWDIEGEKWREALESKHEVIRDEFLKVIANPDFLAANAQNAWVGAQTGEARAYGLGWKTLGLLDRGVWDPVNAGLFPRTAEIIRDSGIPAVEAFFASMEPESSIKLHSDNANFVLTSHLPLVVPDNGQNKCRLTIGDDTKEWLEGKMMMFDTSILHDAVNESDRKRYILMFRVWHPDLSAAERKALQFALDSLSVEELVSDDPAERAEAEKKVAALRAFPDLRKSRPKVVPTSTSGQWKARIDDNDTEMEKITKNKKKKKKAKKSSTSTGGGFGSR